MVIEDDDELSFGDFDTFASNLVGESTSEKANAIVSLLRAVQAEAGNWDMESIRIWNPTHLAIEAAQKMTLRQK